MEVEHPAGRISGYSGIIQGALSKSVKNRDWRLVCALLVVRGAGKVTLELDVTTPDCLLRWCYSLIIWVDICI